MNKKKIIIVIISIIVLIFTYFIYKMISHNEPLPIIEEKYPYTGVYQNDFDTIKIYQVDKEKLYFVIKSLNSDGQAIIKNNEAIGTIYSFSYKYNFTLNNDVLTFKTDDNHFVNGNYSKIRDISLEEFFNEKYGNSKFLNSNFNGKFQNNNNELEIFQTSEKSVRACLKSDKESVCLPFEIIDSKMLKYMSSNDIYSLRFNGNIVDFQTNNANFQKYNNQYSKISDLSMIDIIEFKVGHQ